MEKEQNNAYIDILNLEISYTADFNGFVHISADYCDLQIPNNNNCVTINGDVTIIKMNTGETIKMCNVVGLKMLKFENVKE